MKAERSFVPGDRRFKVGARKKKPSKYDTPTDLKIAVGRRLEAAREANELSQVEVATRLLGYSQAVQLSNMENGHRAPPLDVLIELARLYGTTTDYLLGLTDEYERDTATFVQRLVASRMEGAVARLIAYVSDVSTDVFGRLLPTALQCERMALAVLEAENAMARVRATDKRFDELKGGNPMVAKVQAAADHARAYVEQMSRARRAMSLATVGNEVASTVGPILQIPLLPEVTAADVIATKAVQRAHITSAAAAANTTPPAKEPTAP